MAVLNHVLGQSPVVVTGFMKTTDAAPQAGFISPTGPVNAIPGTTVPAK